MIRHAAALLLSLLLTTSSAQAQWTMHPSLDGTTMAAVAAGCAIAGNSQALTLRDDEEALTQTLTKLNYLSQAGISAIRGDGDNLVVGYSNGDIDIIDIQERQTTNIPELRLNQNLSLKTINSITPAGRYYYVGFASGILQVDPSRAEIRSSWGVTQSRANVTDVCLADGYIYAATSSGIFRAPSNSQILEDANQWQMLSQPTGNTLALETLNDTAYAAIGSLGGDAAIWRITPDGAMKVTTIKKFRHLDAANGKMTVTSTNAVRIFSANWQKEAEVTRVGRADTADAVYSPAFRQACLTKNGDLVIADYNASLVITDTAGIGKAYKPNGPRGNIHTNATAAGDVIYVTGPGRSYEYNNQNYPAAISILRDNTWKESHKTTSTSREPCFVTYNPKNTEEVYLSTWGTGIFKIAADTIGEQYSAANTTLKDIFGGSRYTRTDAMTIDSDGNLYAIACGVDSALNIKTPDGEWSCYAYGPFGAHSNACMTIAPNGNVWLSASRMGGTHVTVFNINGTPETPDDDLYISTAPVTTDRQYVATMSLTDAETGDLVSQRANTIAIDNNGDVWVGTPSGLLVTKDNKTMLLTGSVSFSKIKQPRNDGTNLADYLLDAVDILSIAVDGANRKWIATATEGVYLVSADGSTTIHHFNTDNSPLPSDEVLSIAIRQSDGEVFFVTSVGIASYHSDATEPSDDFSNARIYPNPFSLNGTQDYITIDQLPSDALIYITDAAGARVSRTRSLGGTARWDARYADGRLAAPGVYIAWMTADSGKLKSIGKILITH